MVWLGLATLSWPLGLPAQAQQGMRIRGIVIRRDAVFDSVEARFWPYRLANAMHVQTRTGVIRRELLLDVGDPYDGALAAESERNLRALGIFREVQIAEVVTDTGLVLVVRASDAWTTTVGLGVATSGTQSVVDLSLQEGNLLGTRTVALLSYRNDPDRSAIALAFDTPRAIDDVIGVGASLVERSDGRARNASLRWPFVSLSSRYGGSLSTAVAEGRVLQFTDGVVADSFWRESAVLRGDAALALVGGPRGYTRVGILAQWRRDDIVPLELRSSIPRTRAATAGVYLSARAPRYIRVRNVERIGPVEDIDLGPSLTVSLLAAPAAWGYDANGAGVSLGGSVGARLPGGFARVAVRGSMLETTSGTDSATVEGTLSLVSQPGPRHLVVFHGSVGQLRRPVPGREYDLGLGTGLRAFPAHAFTGDRFYIVAGEYRALMWPRMFGLVGVGAALFAGHAGAWYHGHDSRQGTEAGIGLRLASIRETGGIWRFDVSRRFRGAGFGAGWVASVGRGFVFGGI